MYIFYLAGSHIQYAPTKLSVNNPFAKFVTKKLTCINCKEGIDKGALCKKCLTKCNEIYIERQLEVNWYERLYNDLWTQCQRCQGSYYNEVICQNYDCPIFFKRLKTKKDLSDIQSKLERFNEHEEW